MYTSKMKKIVLLFITLLNCSALSWGQLKVTSVNELLDYVSLNSITLKTDGLKLSQAKKAKLAAIINLIDISGTNNFRFVNNTKLPVSAFPAEIFGGQPGTFTNVTTGVKYTTTATQTAELKLVNLSGWENLKLSRINIDLQNTDNKISLKSLQENIATAYYNVVTLQQQLESNQINQAIADSLFTISENKYRLGLIRLQDVNDAKVTLLNAAESARQSKYLMENYYLALKILCDIPESNELIILDDANADLAIISPDILLNNLSVQNSLLNQRYAKSNYRYYLKQLLPTLSAEVSNSWQLFNTEFNVFNGDWIRSQYVGFKFSIPLPTATQIASINKAKYEYYIAENEFNQAKIKATLDHSKLKNSFEKAVSQYLSDKEILSLRKDSYKRNINLFLEGVIALNDVLKSYDTMVSANYSLISSKVAVLLARANIDINNKIQ